MSKRKASSESKQITKKPRQTEETPYVHSCVFDGTLERAKCHTHQATACLKKGLALFHFDFHNKEVQLINEQIMLGPVLSRDPQRIICSYTKPSFCNTRPNLEAFALNKSAAYLLKRLHEALIPTLSILEPLLNQQFGGLYQQHRAMFQAILPRTKEPKEDTRFKSPLSDLWRFEKIKRVVEWCLAPNLEWRLPIYACSMNLYEEYPYLVVEMEYKARHAVQNLELHNHCCQYDKYLKTATEDVRSAIETQITEMNGQLDKISRAYVMARGSR